MRWRRQNRYYQTPFCLDYRIALTPSHVDWALRGWHTYGRGRHATNLNLGDCFSYALAKAPEEPLLYKGDDFPLTNVKSVDPPS